MSGRIANFLGGEPMTCPLTIRVVLSLLFHGAQQERSDSNVD